MQKITAGTPGAPGEPEQFSHRFAHNGLAPLDALFTMPLAREQEESEGDISAFAHRVVG
jgi:hypothetical protein